MSQDDQKNVSILAVEEVLSEPTAAEDNLPTEAQTEEYYNRLYATIATETDVADMWGIDPITSSESDSLDPMSVDEDYIYISSSSSYDDSEDPTPTVDPEYDHWGDHFDNGHPANWADHEWANAHQVLRQNRLRRSDYQIPEHNPRKRRRILPDLRGIENDDNLRHDQNNNE